MKEQEKVIKRKFRRARQIIRQIPAQEIKQNQNHYLQTKNNINSYEWFAGLPSQGYNGVLINNNFSTKSDLLFALNELEENELNSIY